MYVHPHIACGAECPPDLYCLIMIATYLTIRAITTDRMDRLLRAVLPMLNIIIIIHSELPHNMIPYINSSQMCAILAISAHLLKLPAEVVAYDMPLPIGKQQRHAAIRARASRLNLNWLPPSMETPHAPLDNFKMLLLEVTNRFGPCTTPPAAAAPLPRHAILCTSLPC